MRSIAKKIVVFIGILILLMAMAGPSAVPVFAQSGPSILQSTAQPAFPDTLTFNLSAQSGADITDIRLHYVVEHVAFADVTSEADVNFTAGKTVSASWTLDLLQLGGLPPGTNIDYWWTVSDAAGNKTDSPKATLTFDDGRYAWRNMAGSNMTIYWYEGNDAFANELMAAAKDALARLARDTGATLEKPVRLYIYSGPQDLRGSMINPQEWTGGVAFTRYSIIAIGISTNNLDWGKGAMAHELTHLVIAQVTANPYAGLPTWLDEGLAMYTEGPLGSDYQSILDQATRNSALISVRSLASPFSAYGDQAYLSYAESYSIVKYLIDKYGQSKMLELLRTFREGATYDDALKKTYGFDMDGLNAQWQQSLTGQKPAQGSAGLPDILTAGLAVGSPLFFVAAPLVRRMAAKKHEDVLYSTRAKIARHSGHLLGAIRRYFDRTV